MNVVVAGSRTITDEKRVFEILDKSPFEITELVSGHAAGVDRCGEEWAKSRGIPTKIFLPDYTNTPYPKLEPLMRNTKMALYSEALIAIWDGQSHGTKHMICEMERLDKPFWVYREPPIPQPVINEQNAVLSHQTPLLPLEKRHKHG
jgi:hypothetical protein